MLGSLAENESEWSNFLFSEDCLNTLEHFQKMGVKIHINQSKKTLKIQGVGLRGLKSPNTVLECGNAGTSIRLMMGIMCGQPFASVLTGDASIQSRPMKRVIDPLGQMGAKIEGVIKPSKTDIYPPLNVKPVTQLTPITYTLPVASAQVKSAILLASLYANEPTCIIEPIPSRDHTERMLTFLGADFHKEGQNLYCSGKNSLKNPSSSPILIPADISSAAFFIVLGCILPNSQLTLSGVGINPTRDGILTVLKRMGARITHQNPQMGVEPTADLVVNTSPLQNREIFEHEISNVIDELPILAVAALFAKGTMKVRGAQELRHKESDRISAIAQIVHAMGGHITEYPDGFDISAPDAFPASFEINSNGDHRIAMAAIIAGLGANAQVTVRGAQCIATSFPNFMECVNQL